MSKSGTTIRYEYNHNGLRTQKFVDTSNKTDAAYYTYNGKNIIHVIKNSDHLHIFYDAQNRPAKVSHNGIFYTYLYNLQGDVVGLLDKNGALVVEYKYDAWGKPLSITGTLANTLGQFNPFRYRGYVYDEETGLYYLRSRYYNSVWGRFINSDVYVTTGCGIHNGNSFVYGNNTPILLFDPNGTKVTSSFSYAMVVGIGAGYNSADAAAKSFSQSVYSQSRYIRHEYATVIYSKEVSGTARYFYTKPTSGDPHGVKISLAVPNGTRLVAYAHTHPNSSNFSPADKRIALKHAIDAYVATPDLNVLRFSHDTEETMIVGTITLVTLTAEQKEQLRAEFEASWYGHIANGDANGFDCSDMTWPTE